LTVPRQGPTSTRLGRRLTAVTPDCPASMSGIPRPDPPEKLDRPARLRRSAPPARRKPPVRAGAAGGSA
jgi:hypothetical protein